MCSLENLIFLIRKENEMAKEIEKDVNVTVPDVTDNADKNADEIASEELGRYFVKRVEFGKNKNKTKDVFDYSFVVKVPRTNPKTNEIVLFEKTINIVPEDKRGYELLDIIYAFKDTAELVVERKTFKMDGQTINSVKYKLIDVEPSSGEIISCIMKGRESSDKQSLEMFFH